MYFEGILRLFIVKSELVQIHQLLLAHLPLSFTIIHINKLCSWFVFVTDQLNLNKLIKKSDFIEHNHSPIHDCFRLRCRHFLNYKHKINDKYTVLHSNVILSIFRQTIKRKPSIWNAEKYMVNKVKWQDPDVT